MNYTQNYHLPQWEKTDRVLMEDFNDAMAGIESGITEAKTAAGHAQNTAEQIPFVIGSYYGNGKTLDVDMGFRPRFVIISGLVHVNSDNLNPETALVGPGSYMDLIVKLTDTGMTVNEVTTYHPRLNQPGLAYGYIAFR